MAMRKMHFHIVNDYMYMNEEIKSWKLENNYFLWIFSDITLSKSKESIIADVWVDHLFFFCSDDIIRSLEQMADYINWPGFSDDFIWSYEIVRS